MAWVRTAAEEAKMPLTSMFILTIAFECATTDWSIGGLVEKLDSGAWHTACWVYAVGAATSLKIVSLADNAICHGSDADYVKTGVGRVVSVPC